MLLSWVLIAIVTVRPSKKFNVCYCAPKTIDPLHSPYNIPHEKEKRILGRGTEVLAVYCDLNKAQEQTFQLRRGFSISFGDYLSPFALVSSVIRVHQGNDDLLAETKTTATNTV